MKSYLKRLTALLLVLAMCLSLISANVWAAEMIPQETTPSIEEDQNHQEEISDAVSEPEPEMEPDTESESEEEQPSEDTGDQSAFEEEEAKEENKDTVEREPVSEIEVPVEQDTEKSSELEAEEESGEGLSPQEIVASGECGEEGDNVTWTLDDTGMLTISGTGEMKGYSNAHEAPWYGSSSSIKNGVIRSGVTSIGNHAFSGCSSLTSVTILDSVTSIGGSAFSGCSSLRSITIPDSVTSIGYYAFSGCSSLTSISIPDSVTSIEGYAFTGCNSLTSVTIPDSVTSIGGAAFSGCSSLRSITIPDSVTSIGGAAFSGCSSLRSITIPDSVTSIGYYAFSGCSSLTSISIPDSVTSIGGYAFTGCSSLTSVTIPDSVTSIWGPAFRGCSSLTAIQANAENRKYSSIDGILFDKRQTTLICCPGGKDGEYSIPNSVTSIGGSAFYGCNSLTSITIPDSVTSIGDDAFRGCSSLTSITIPDSVTSIGDYAFSGCSSLTSITIPDGVTSIGNSAFRWCSSLTSVTIPFSVTSIGGAAFDGCSSLTSVVIPKSITIIYDSTFDRCTSLTDVYYSGSQEEWNTISIRKNNAPLKKATIHYNSTGPHAPPSFTPVSPGQIKEDYTFTSDLKKDNNDNSLNIVNSFRYADVWLMSDDASLRYELMKTSIRVAQAAFGQNGSANIKEMMSKMGYYYTDDSIVYEDPEINTIGSAIGVKNIKKGDGTFQSLILVAIRGGGYGTEWGGNFNVGNDSKYHAGFEKAANTVHGRLAAFLAANQEHISSDPIVWITGFSRGAATSNLLASYLINGRKINGTKIEIIQPDNVLAFCFECPKNVVDSNASDAKYNNIINIVNPIDFVPKLAFNRWNFSRYGRTYCIPSKETTPGFVEKYKYPMIWKYQALCDYNSIQLTDDYVVELNGQASNLDSLLDEVSSKITRNRYSMYVQNSMIEIAASALGNGGGNVNWFHAIVSMIAAVSLPADGGDMMETAVKLAIGKLSPVKKLKFIEKAASLFIHAPSVFVMFKDANSCKGPGASAHYSELCLSWVDSLSGFSAYNTEENSWYRRHIINCPVDVTVRDHNGNVVGKVTNHQAEEIEDGAVAFVDENEQIVFVLPMCEEYTVEVQATDSGTVDYMIQEVNGAKSTLENVITYQEIPVEDGDEITVQSSDGNTDLDQRYVLQKESEASPRQPYAVLTDEEVERFAVTTTVEGNGTVTGGGDTIKGEYVKVTAEAGKEAQFLGWFDGETCVSQTEEYRIRVDCDIALKAVFTTDTSIIAYTTNGSASVGEVTISDGPFHTGDSVTVTAPKVDGYFFRGWYPVTEVTEGSVTGYDTADQLAATLEYTFQMEGDTSIVAVYVSGAPTAKDLTYTGAELELVNPGHTESGGLLYSTSENGTYSTTIPAKKDAGTYTVWYKDGEGGVPESVEVTISEKMVGLDWSDTIFVYDGEAHVPAATASGIIDGDTCTVTIDGAEINASTTSYTATATGLSNSNYKLPDEVTQDFTISPKGVTMTPDEQSTAYGEDIAELTFTVEGLVKESDMGSLKVMLSTTASKTAPAGSYAITGTQEEGFNTNYSVTIVDGKKYTINQADATITARAYSGVYDGQEHGICISVTDSRSEGNIFSLIGKLFGKEPDQKAEATVYYSTVSVEDAQEKKNTIAPTRKDVGTTAVFYAVEFGGNYSADPVTGSQTVTITAQEVGLTWSNTSFTYDGKPHFPTATATGLLGSDACTVTVDSAQTNAGTYTATATALSNENYKLPAAVTHTFTIKEESSTTDPTLTDPTPTNPTRAVPTPTNPTYDNLTASQKKLADSTAASLEVNAETAAQMVQVAAQMGVSADVMQLGTKKLASMNVDSKDPKGSTFYRLNARASKRKEDSLTLQWKKHKKADGYLLYGNKCGKKNKLKLLKTIEGRKTTKWTQKKLKKGTYYKYIVIAYKNFNGQKMPIAASVTVHASTKGGKKTVAKGLTLTQGKKVVTKLTLKKKASATIKASEVPEEKLKIESHRKVKFESDNTEVASVSASGKITAKKKGKATIYAYAQNGIFKTVKVTVK